MERKRQWEIASSGLDEYLQLVGSDPFGSQSSVGLRVPTAASTPKNRYLMLLAGFTVAEGACVRIRGYRQLVTIGYAQPKGEGGTATYVVEQEVQSPFWRFSDGNISWHLRKMGPPNAQAVPRTLDAGPVDSDSFKCLWADGAACLYGNPAPARPAGNVYTNVVGYVPPNGGKPYGEDVNAKLGTFYDLRTQWRTHGGWEALDIPIRGPETVALFASVKQSDPSRTSLTLPKTFYAGGLSVEEQFLQNFPNAIYWRVGGALRVEEG